MRKFHEFCKIMLIVSTHRIREEKDSIITFMAAGEVASQGFKNMS